VLLDINMALAGDGVTWEQLRTSPDLLADIEVDSTIWFTTTYLNAAAPDGTTQTCTAAYANILAFTDGNFRPAWHEYIADQLGLDDAVVGVQESMDALFGIGKDAQAFMMNSLIARELRLADLGYHAAADNTAGVIMRTQAIEQRRTQWATEQSLFLEVARPLIAYIEAFFYAVSPFMAFLFTLGSMGITLFARYLLLAIWIQLWMPVLAINNLYIHIGASNQLQAIDAGGTDVISMIGMESVWTETATWIATGGMMAAATPLLTLVLISGSYFAFTRLTDRMGGGDTINERIGSPDVLQPAAVGVAGANFFEVANSSRDPVQGDILTGAAGVVPHINVGSSLSNDVSSARASQQQAVSQWAAGASQGLDLRRSQDMQQFARNLSSESTSSNQTQVDNVMEQMSRAALNNDALFSQLTSEERSTLTGAIGASLSGRGGAGGAGAGGNVGVNGALSQIESLSETQRQEVAERISQLASSESGFRTELANAIQQTAVEGEVSQYARALGVSDSTQFRETQQDVASTTRSYNELSALRTSVGVNQSVPITAFGNASRDDESLRQLTGLAAKHGVNMGEVDSDVGVWTSSGLMHDRNAAYAASIGTHLTEGDAAARADLGRFMSERFGNVTPDLEDPLYTPGAPNVYGDATDRVDSNVVGAPFGGSAFGASVDGNLSEFGSGNAEARGAVQRFFEANQAGNAERREEALRDLDEIINRNRADFAEATFQSDRGVLEVIGDYDVTGGLGRATSQFGTSIGYAAAAYQVARNEALENGHNEFTAQIAGLGALGGGWNEGFQKVVEEKYDRFYDQATEAGLPDVAAQYYADNAIWMDQAVDQAFSRYVGWDDEFNARRAEVEGMLGPQGREMLERAANTEGEKGQRILGDAVSIYRRDN
jgi:type IV secretory system conjugative DNA transfer VirD4/TraG family protein